MEKPKFHKDFKLNGSSFSSEEVLLDFTQNLDDAIFQFLKIWLNNKETIAVHTSGSTGKPKSILLEKKLMQNSAKATGAYFSLPAKTKALLCLPIEYIAGKMMLVRALTLGWQLDYITPSSKPLENVSKSYDFSAMVPLQLENSLDKINQIDALIVGGGAVSTTLQNKLQSIKTSVFATYGMTETITHVAVKQLNKLEKWQKTNSGKKSFYQTLPDVYIYKDNRNCLVIDAPNVSNDIIFTNDVVQLISENKFEWLGRFDNVINSGGVKIHPEKIEEKLSKFIEKRFFVVGIKDDVLGEKLVLIVEGKEENTLIDKVFNTRSLTKFEQPKALFFVSKFVETPTGKIQRKKTLDLINQ